MTEVRARRIVCEAALLENNSEAAALLRQALDTLTVQDEAMGALMLAYAWVAPEEAQLFCKRHPWTGRTRLSSWLYDDWLPTVPDEIERIGEAHWLYPLDAEGREAYAALTALIPRTQPVYAQRRSAQRLVCALDSSEKFLALPSWETSMVRYDGLSVFLAARLWRNCPDLLWEKLQALPRLAPLLWPIGQWVLCARNKPEELSLLIAITRTQCEKQGGTYSGTELSAVFKSLEVLEVQAPQELRSILPAVLKVISRGNGERDSVLAAYTLVLVIRLKLDGYELIRPLVSRVRGRKSISSSRRWARQIQRRLRQHEPEQPLVQGLTYLLRILALERSIDGILVRTATHKTESQVWLARRWLQRSDSMINAVSDRSWREYLRGRKKLLASKVATSRKAAHIIARSSETE